MCKHILHSTNIRANIFTARQLKLHMMPNVSIHYWLYTHPSIDSYFLCSCQRVHISILSLQMSRKQMISNEFDSCWSFFCNFFVCASMPLIFRIIFLLFVIFGIVTKTGWLFSVKRCWKLVKVLVKHCSASMPATWHRCMANVVPQTTRNTWNWS